MLLRSVTVRLRRSERPEKLPRQRRKLPNLGRVRDIDGVWWLISDIRPGKHGFDLFYGFREDRAGRPDGPARLIVTEALRKYWFDNRTNLGATFDLPAGRTTLKRARHRLGFNFIDARHEFWNERVLDLATMTDREFSVTHGIDMPITQDWRRRLIGNVAREHGWWRTPDFIEILLSGLTLREMGEKLGVKTSQAFRLRRQAMAEYRTPLDQAA